MIQTPEITVIEIFYSTLVGVHMVLKKLIQLTLNLQGTWLSSVAVTQWNKGIQSPLCKLHANEETFNLSKHSPVIT